MQVDAEKRVLIKHLPHTLVLHLKRFEFDYETFQRWKVGCDCMICAVFVAICGATRTRFPLLVGVRFCDQPMLPCHRNC